MTRALSLTMWLLSVVSTRAAVGSLAWAKAHEGKEATLPSLPPLLSHLAHLKDPTGLLTSLSGLIKKSDDSAGLLTRAAATKPFNQHAMIMAHDAATSYLEGGLLHQINQWTKTQADGGFTGMLNCGARAFDFRAKMDDGKLIFHHGPISVPHAVSDALDEIVDWANVNAKTAEEIVLVHAFTCEGDGCAAALADAFAQRNITYITDCGELKGLTLQGAASRAKLPGGGLVLAVKDCLVDHYQSEVACSGYLSGDTTALGKEAAQVRAEAAVAEVEAGGLPSFYTCYADSSSNSYPLERMFSYLNNVSKAAAPSSGYLYSHQALWQETEASVAIGVTQLSSLLKDEERAKLNALLTERVTSGQWDVSTANLVELNNVCDGGPALLAALRKAQAVGAAK